MSLSRTWTICAVREAAGASMPSLIMRMLSEKEVAEVYSLAHPATGDRFLSLIPQKLFRARATHVGHTTRGVTPSVTRLIKERPAVTKIVTPWAKSVTLRIETSR